MKSFRRSLPTNSPRYLWGSYTQAEHIVGLSYFHAPVEWITSCSPHSGYTSDIVPGDFFPQDT